MSDTWLARIHRVPGTIHQIYVVTSRKRDLRLGTFYNGERAKQSDYAQFAVSVPPHHKLGEIEISSTPPGNPARDFVTLNGGYLNDKQSFIRRVNNSLAQRPAGKRKVLLFIHGYNTLFAEGLYRLAQLTHDSKTTSLPVLFSWASRGHVTSYVYDSNSATIARDNLENTIRSLLKTNAEGIDIIAHSMGNFILVEAIRQIKLSKVPLDASRIGTVILAAPDLDIDVFESQLHRIGRFVGPIYWFCPRTIRRLVGPV